MHCHHLLFFPIPTNKEKPSSNVTKWNETAQYFIRKFSNLKDIKHFSKCNRTKHVLCTKFNYALLSYIRNN